VFLGETVRESVGPAAVLARASAVVVATMTELVASAAPGVSEALEVLHPAWALAAAVAV
jgi:hypothetical protein